MKVELLEDKTTEEITEVQVFNHHRQIFKLNILIFYVHNSFKLGLSCEKWLL